jgi:hypothetical protein
MRLWHHEGLPDSAMKAALARASIIAVPLLTMALLSEVLFDKAPAVYPIQSQSYNGKTTEIKLIDKRWLASWINISILQRPVFSRSRRPPRAMTSAKLAYQTARLSGIIIAPGIRCAILSLPDVAKPVVITEGMAFADTYVRSIKRFEVSFANGIVLRTSFDPNSSRQHREESPVGPSTRHYPVDPNFQTLSLPPSSIRSSLAQ